MDEATVMAQAVLDYLNATYEEHEIELDQDKADLYNLATAIVEADPAHPDTITTKERELERERERQTCTD